MKNKYYQNLEAAKLKQPKRIELAIKDYKDFAIKIEKLNSSINKNVAFQIKAYEKIKKGVAIAKDDGLEVKSIVEKARKQYNKDLKAAKDLGVDTSIFTKTFELIEKLADRSNKDLQSLKIIK